jgi:regulator of sigma E protease
VVIPSNYDLPFDWRTGLKRQVIATADEVGDRLELRTIELVASADTPPSSGVSEMAQVLSEIDPSVSPKPKSVGTLLPAGAVTLTGTLSELMTGTEYTLNWLPIGGFVRPKGEFDPTAPGGLAASSPWTRLWVLLAGPAMNLLAGVLIFSIYIAQVGVPVTNTVLLTEVLPDSPAFSAGLKAGDVILNMNGQEIASMEQFRNMVQTNLDQSIQVIYERDGKQFTTTVTPSSQRAADQGATGVMPGNPIQKVNYLQAVPVGFRITGVYIYELLTLPARLIQGAIAPDQARFVGLKGIYDFMSQAVQSDTESRQAVAQAPTPASAPQPTNYTLTLIGMLTLSLGVFNLLPIPALDGGRIMFLLPEFIFRRRVPPDVEMKVNAVGMMLLLLFMLVVNVMDFVSPVAKLLP